MPSLFFTLNIARRGLTAQQAAMNTSGHNIANANTEGYSRQRAVMQTTTPWPVPSVNMPVGAGQIGTGVEVALIERIRDTFLDRQIRNELQALGHWEQRSDALQQVEVVFMEPGETGLSTLLSQFWDSWQELSKYPESMPVRTTVVETAQALAEALRHTHQQLTTLRSDLNQLIDLKVEEINTLARQIADLNQQIFTITAAGMSPNDLLDRRDLLLDQLSKIIAITVEPVTIQRNGQEIDTGAVRVKLAGQSGAQPLIDGESTNQVFASLDADPIIGIVSNNTLLDSTTPITNVSPSLEPGSYLLRLDVVNNTLRLEDDGQLIASAALSGNEVVILEDSSGKGILTVRLQDPTPDGDASINLDILGPKSIGGEKGIGGELEGLHTARDEVVTDYLAALDAFAQALADAVNEVHRGGIGLDNESFNLPFFVGQTASDIEVNSDLLSQPEMLAAGFWRASIGSDTTGLLTDDARLGPGIVTTAYYQIEVTVATGGQVQVQLKKGGDNWGNAVDWVEGQWITLGVDNESVRFLCGDLPSTGTYDVNPITDDMAPGDGTNALAIAQLRREQVPALGGFTFDDYYKNLIARLGVASNEARRMAENQNVLVEQLNQRKESISGVSLDEEMVNLIQYQYAYQAAARVITVVDEMLDTIINRMAQ